jgi:uncharacterized protein (TIGR01777 family)
MKPIVVLAAGTGQIGQALQKFFLEKGFEIRVLTRGKSRQTGNVSFYHWDGKTPGTWYDALKDAEILVNLAGKNVNCRYHERNRKEIMESRTDSVLALAAACHQLENKPRVWVQLASATIYRHATDRPMRESDGEMENDFSVQVCKAWESTFLKALEGLPIRPLVLRTSLVLSREEGVFPRLRRMVYGGLGGFQGNGKQMVSWIHEADFCGLLWFLIQHEKSKGIYNATAPEPVSNQVFMKALRQKLGMPFGLPAPAWMLEIGAWLIGTETELILKSRWVLPDRLSKEGYTFQFPDVHSAFADLSSRS